MKKIILIIIACFLILTLSIYLVRQKSNKTYAYEELNSMSTTELYNTFLDNGLVVNDELKSNLSEKEIAEMLKEDFETLSKGITARNHFMYYDFSNEVKRVYVRLVKVK